jgi:uncharacterized protein YggU (UPF0235/DUF167 family)
VRPDGLVVEVRLTPRAALDRIDGIETLADGASALKVRTRALPEKGRANAALLALLATAAGLPASRARLVAGAGSRRKSVLLEGDGAALATALESLCAAKG